MTICRVFTFSLKTITTKQFARIPHVEEIELTEFVRVSCSTHTNKMSHTKLLFFRFTEYFGDLHWNSCWMQHTGASRNAEKKFRAKHFCEENVCSTTRIPKSSIGFDFGCVRSPVLQALLHETWTSNFWFDMYISHYFLECSFYIERDCQTSCQKDQYVFPPSELDYENIILVHCLDPPPGWLKTVRARASYLHRQVVPDLK